MRIGNDFKIWSISLRDSQVSWAYLKKRDFLTLPNHYLGFPNHFVNFIFTWLHETFLPLILKLFIAFKVSRYTLLHFFPYSFRKYLQYISWFSTAKALYYVLCKTKGFLLLILRSLQSDGKHRDLHKEQ